jgi:acyl-CoA synthetase (AMP-forming)/AMP-acid ligase II
MRERINLALSLIASLRRARLIAPMRPGRLVRMAAAMRRENFAATYGFAAAAQRCPDRPALVDERGSLTWRQLDQRCDALASALQALPGGQPKTLGIMCRNHRGFVEALVAGNRIGADVLLLNTSFAGPALADVLVREAADAAIYDEEFAEAVDHALAQMPAAKKILAWRDDTEVGLPRHDGTLTLDQMISDHTNEVPERATHKSRTILLTSGTTGSPKGAKLGSGDLTTLAAVLTRTPWRAEETVVIAAPMFHAWGYGQLVFAALMACTVVTRRKFDPEATLGLIDRHLATGLAVVPVMLDRIMDLPEDVRSRYSCRSLRFATASGSRMRPDVVIGFMNQFGDVIVNNYNATEAGLIASATPQDLRAAPDTAGKPALGTRVRILDEHVREVPTGEVGQIFVHNGTHFEGYSAGATKEFRDGFMASGDVGFLDDNGRLFVVGRDDEMIVSGGENIHPIEVEKSLVGHPEVAEAAVIGVDDEEFGQRLAAFVVLRSDATATPEVLKGYVRQNLANYKVPRQIIVLGELPRNATGKVLRSQLRALIA